jgi:hypothetical protein
VLGRGEPRIKQTGAWHKRLYNKRNRRIRFAHPAIFEPFSVYCLGEAAGLAPSFFFPLPAFTSTSVADMV